MSDIFIIFLSSKLHIVIAVSAVVYFLYVSLHKKIILFILGAITIPSAYIVASITRIWIETERPFVTLGVQPLVPHIVDNGFPSEHALYALIIAGVIWSVHKKFGVVLIISALLVGMSRVIALVHNPIDIVGSIVISLGVITAVNIFPVSSYIDSFAQRKVKVIQEVLEQIRVSIGKN